MVSITDSELEQKVEDLYAIYKVYCEEQGKTENLPEKAVGLDKKTYKIFVQLALWLRDKELPTPEGWEELTDETAQAHQS